MRLVCAIAALALALALASSGCGDDDSASETTVAEGSSEVAQVIAVKKRGEALHAEFVESRKLQRTCMRLMKSAGRSAEDAWFEAVEEEAAEVTPEQQQAMRGYEDAFECVRQTEAEIKRFGAEIEKLTKRLDTFSPAAIERAVKRLSS